MLIRNNQRRRSTQRGATIVEYVLLIALIGVVAITAMSYLGGVSGNKLNNAGTVIETSNTTP